MTRPVLAWLPLLVAAWGIHWGFLDPGVPYDGAGPAVRPPPGAWVQMETAYVSLQFLARPVGVGGAALAVAWTALLCAAGPRRIEARLRALTGWSPPGTRLGWTAHALFLLGVAILLRAWTVRHYVEYPLQIRNPDAWCLYAAAGALRDGADPYLTSAAVGNYAYPPWLLTILLPTLPRDDMARAAWDATERPEGPPVAREEFLRWRSRFLLLKLAALPLLGAGILALVAPDARRRALPLVVLLLAGNQEIATDFRQGQITPFLLSAFLAFALGVERGFPLAGGFVAGLAVPTKLFPGILLPYALWVREYRAAVGIAAGALLGFGMPVLLHGWDLTARGRMAMDAAYEGLVREPAYEHNQSAMMALSRAWDSAAARGWIPPAARPAVLRTAAPAIALAGLAILAAGIPRRRPNARGEILGDLAGIVPVCLLIFPQVSSYQFMLHVLPLTALVPTLAIGAARPRAALAAGMLLTLAWFLAQFQGYGDYRIHLVDSHRPVAVAWDLVRPIVSWIPAARDACGKNWGTLAAGLTLCAWWILRRRDAAGPRGAAAVA